MHIQLQPIYKDHAIASKVHQEKGILDINFMEATFNDIRVLLQGKLSPECLQSYFQRTHEDDRRMVIDLLWIMLQQSSDRVRQRDSHSVWYKYMYTEVMEGSRAILYHQGEQSQSLIDICRTHLMATNKLTEDQGIIRTAQEKDNQYLLEVMLKLSWNEKSAKDIIFQLNQMGNISEIVFSNYRNILKESTNCLPAIQASQLWIRSKNPMVMNQIIDFFEGTQFEIDTPAAHQILNLLLEIAEVLQTSQSEIYELYKQLFSLLWSILNLKTQKQYYDQKTQFWCDYFKHLNDISTDKKTKCPWIQAVSLVHIALKDWHNIFEEQYYFDYKIIPFCLIELFQQQNEVNIHIRDTCFQEMILLAIEYMLQNKTNPYMLSDTEYTKKHSKFFEQLLQIAIHLNSTSKQKIIQLVWCQWDINDYDYIVILQIIVELYLQGENQLGSRNLFFRPILMMQEPQGYKKIKLLIQLFQYTCLEKCKVNVGELFFADDTYFNLTPLMKSHVVEGAQDFFQNNKYMQILMSTIDINDAHLLDLMKELFKLVWLVTHNIKIEEIEFSDDFISFALKAVKKFTPAENTELFNLVTNCMTNQIYQKIPNTDTTLLREIPLQHHYCLKIIIDIFSSQQCNIQEHALKVLSELLYSNQYNQYLFRETVSFSSMISEMQDTSLSATCRDLLVLIVQKGLEYIRNIDLKQMHSPSVATNKYQRFKQKAFSQYVGKALQNSNEKSTKDDRKQLLLLGVKSRIFITGFNLSVLKSFAIFIEFKQTGTLDLIGSNIQQSEQILISIEDTNPIFQVILRNGKIQVRLPNQVNKNDGIDFLSDNTQTLMIQYEHRAKHSNHESISIKANDHDCSYRPTQLFSNAKNTNIVLGGYGFQGIISNFIIIDGRYGQQLKEKIVQQLETALTDSMDNDSREFHNIYYLDIDKFRSSNNNKQIEDALKAIKLQVKENQKKNFLLDMLKKSKFVIVNESQKCVQTWYQGVYCIERLSLAEVFLTLENLDMIIFIIQNETRTPLRSPLTQMRGSNADKKTQIWKGRYSEKNGVFKIVNYSDVTGRKLFLVQDQKKTVEQYLSCHQFQIKKMEDQLSQNKEPYFGQSSDTSLDQSPVMRQVSPLQKQVSIDQIKLQQRSDNQFQDSFVYATPDVAECASVSPMLRRLHSIQPIVQQFTPNDQISPSPLNHLHTPSIRDINRSHDSILAGELITGIAREPDQEPPRSGSDLQKFQRSSSRSKTNLVVKRVTIEEKNRSSERKSSYKSQKLIPNISSSGSGNTNITFSGVTDGKLEQQAHDNKKVYHAEFITLKGQYFGNLTIDAKGTILKFKFKGKKIPKDKPFYQYGSLMPIKGVKQDFEKTIEIGQISEIHSRRFSLKEIAVEIFVNESKAYFFNLFNEERTKLFLQTMKEISNKRFWVVQDRRKIFEKKEFTKKWQKGELTNFEYLMLVNKYSGRTFNDLNQYYVFPWVISDYKSQKLDLSKESSYRDLELPIGAIGQARLKECKEKFEMLKEAKQQAYLYGSHYSIPAQIINTMVRLEPFTSLMTELQDGKLDQPDRLFFSIPNTWDSCTTDQQDFRELIPEYFYCPDFLRNVSNIDFGLRQNDEPVDNVILPPWAKDAENFIAKQREALESDIVSNKIHHWINLIFGVHQSDNEAVKHDNCFCWTTYENCWKHIDILTPSEKEAYLTQIQSFGQVPFQLFTKAHERKAKRESLSISLIPENIKKSNDLILLAKFDKKLIYRIFKDQDNLIIISEKMIYKIKYEKYDKDRVPAMDKPYMKLNDLEKIHQESCYTTVENNPTQSMPLDIQYSYHKGQLFVAGYESGSVYVYNVSQDRCNIDKLIKLHRKRVKCVIYSPKYKLICLGSKDYRITVWHIQENQDKTTQRYQTPKFILYGHVSSIKCMKIDEQTQCIITVDKSNLVLIHSIRTGYFIKEIQLDTIKHEHVRQIEIDECGVLIFLTNISRLLIYRYSGFRVDTHDQYKNISYIQFFKPNKLIVSNFQGELFCLENFYGSKSETTSWMIHQNTKGIGIQMFIYFYENHSLNFMMAMKDGTIQQYCIHSESESKQLNYLKNNLIF